MTQNKAYTALLGVSTQDFFNFIKGDPSLFGRRSHACACGGLGRWVSH
jgi:hypothetical protein